MQFWKVWKNFHSSYYLKQLQKASINGCVRLPPKNIISVEGKYLLPVFLLLSVINATKKKNIPKPVPMHDNNIKARTELNHAEKKS